MEMSTRPLSGKGVLHESDSMKANHEFTFSEETMGADMFNLILKQQGKIVKKVDMPVETEDTVNIGKMNKDEFDAFMEITVKVSRMDVRIYGRFTR